MLSPDTVVVAADEVLSGEFDDEAVGTRHLLVAYAGLERDCEPT